MDTILRKRPARITDGQPARPEGRRRKKELRVAAAFTAFLAVAVAAAAGRVPVPEAAGGGPAPLPLAASLDAFYPPAADRPVYLLEMVALENSFSGIVVDVMEDDFEGARGLFAEFRRQYREIAAKVPEWRGEYPEEAVAELGAALAAGDRAGAMGAFAAVGGICHRCHLAAMVPVQQKYHWGNFGALTVPDPLSGEEVAYPQFKRYLSANLAGVTTNLRQGQTDNARRQFEAFQARFGSLVGSCGQCHGNESKAFADGEIRATVERLGEVLRSRSVAADSAAALVQEIGRESCSKCHRVHLPAALAGRHSPR